MMGLWIESDISTRLGNLKEMNNFEGKGTKGTKKLFSTCSSPLAHSLQSGSPLPWEIRVVAIEDHHMSFPSQHLLDLQYFSILHMLEGLPNCYLLITINHPDDLSLSFSSSNHVVLWCTAWDISVAGPS